MTDIVDGIEEQEAALRNAHLRHVYGPIQSYALWRPSDIDITTCLVWWESVRDDESNDESNDTAKSIQRWWLRFK